jgi:hypothetical protein
MQIQPRLIIINYDKILHRGKKKIITQTIREKKNSIVKRERGKKRKVLECCSSVRVSGI